MTDDREHVIDLELQLLDPRVRASAEGVAALLHPRFVEIGASGRVWDRAAMVAALQTDPSVSGTAHDVSAEVIDNDVILLTYRVDGTRTTRRSSLWVRDRDGSWLLRFHQGTQVPS